jgi:hypothetical protein
MQWTQIAANSAGGVMGQNGGRTIHHNCHRRHGTGRKRRNHFPFRGVALGGSVRHRRNYRDAVRVRSAGLCPMA